MRLTFKKISEGIKLNRSQAIILQALLLNRCNNQRQLAKLTGFSLGKINQNLKQLKAERWLTADNRATPKTQTLLQSSQPQHAVILAAGYGMRMVPINTEQPKGLLQVHGQTLIERLIQQLHAVGVKQIDVIVGFMKEHFEFLTDKYGVNLIVNSHYHEFNNLFSLALVNSQHLHNSYIIPSDVWLKENPFHPFELYPWYMVSSQSKDEQPWYSTKARKFNRSDARHPGNIPVGIAYLTDNLAQSFAPQLMKDAQSSQYNNNFWESALVETGWDQMSSNIIEQNHFAEINTYEELLNLDANSDHLNNQAIDIITKQLGIQRQQIHHIEVLKKGMTNRSFKFSVDDRRYIMRIPGAGTNKLINRKHEAAVYKAIQSLHIAEPVLYFDPDNGYKLSRFIPHSRNCDAHNWDDVQRCMDFLRHFHEENLKVDHQFDLFGQIDFYEQLRGQTSAYRDYQQTKEAVQTLRPYLQQHRSQWTLCHIDANADNFLFVKNGNKAEELRLIDWEYAGMQDPHLDIAMFAAYSMYDRPAVDKLIDCYFHGQCSATNRTKIYGYLAAAGLLWSNWCEYKQTLGLDFGSYSLAQYRFAKNYSQLTLQRMKEGQSND